MTPPPPLLLLLLLLILIIGFAMANPYPNTLDNRLISQARDALLLVAKNRSDVPDEKLDDARSNIPEDTNAMLSVLKHTDHPDPSTSIDESTKRTTQKRKHKAIFVNYSIEPRVSHPKMPAYEINYNDNYNDNSEVTERERDKLRGSKRYQESDIFYIRLPPTPYVFVPGLGYVSQPPTYSTTALKPQLAFIPQLLQLPHVRPAQPSQLQLPSQQNNDPLIKLPIDFVSNGKPTSVYQWPKKKSDKNKKPADSPIMNLDSLSNDFVSNGKPTSVYQWQANFKPAKRPDDPLNSLGLGPYAFNGKVTSVYLLGPDGTTSMHQSVRYPDYQDDYQNVYY